LKPLNPNLENKPLWFLKDYIERMIKEIAHYTEVEKSKGGYGNCYTVQCLREEYDMVWQIIEQKIKKEAP